MVSASYRSLMLFLLVSVMGCQTTGTVRHVDVGVHSEDASVRVVFSDHDRGLIRGYYHERRHKYKHKYKPLPPGHRKHLKRHGHLPPGLESHHLPHDLEHSLSHLRDGYARVRVGGDIVLMDTNTRVIMDVIFDIGR